MRWFYSVKGGYEWMLSAFIIGVFLQLLGLPFIAVSQVSLFSKVTAEKTQGTFLPECIDFIGKLVSFQPIKTTV